MRCYLLAMAVLLLSGCTLPAKYVAYPAGVPIRVLSGYDTFRHAEGNEFVFSIMLPPSDEWYYSRKYHKARKGYLSPTGGRSKKELLIEWIWISRSSVGTESKVKNIPIYLPWYSGETGDGSRISYTPTERQIQSGDWYSVGYPQAQFIQSMYKGIKNYYCVRSVFRRGGRTTWEQERGAPAGAGYSVYDACPFRTTDGRDAYFKITSMFWVSAEEQAANPHVVDEKLAALDVLLQPSWDSLEVMPQAYQFDPPVHPK